MDIVDLDSFLFGYVLCMFMDLIHSFVVFLLDKARLYRSLRKEQMK